MMNMTSKKMAMMMMYPSSNQSLQALGKYSDTEKYLWMVWLIFALTTSVAGNLTVLVGSIKFGAIQLDKVTTTLITHTAVSDIALILTTIPSLVSLTTDTLLYSKDFCAGVSWVNGFLVRSSCLLVAALNVSKLISLLKPFQSIVWSRAKGHKIASGVWLISGLLIGFKAIIARNSKTIFLAPTLRCLSKFSSNDHWILINVESFLSKLIPMGAVIISTVMLIFMLYQRYNKYTRIGQDPSDSRSLNLQAIVTVIAVAVVFIISYGPLYSMIVYKLASGTGSKSVAKQKHILRAFNYMVYLNCVCNFFIYTATVRSFNSFVLKTVKKPYLSIKSSTKSSQINMENL